MKFMPGKCLCSGEAIFKNASQEIEITALSFVGDFRCSIKFIAKL